MWFNFFVLGLFSRRVTSTPKGYNFLYYEDFESDFLKDNWVSSELKNYSGVWKHNKTRSQSYLQLDLKNAFYGISSMLAKPITFTKKSFIVQYEVSAIRTIDCSGAYIKLFGPNKFDRTQLSNETNYVIMFGPDQCGLTNNKIHFILNHWNPVYQKFEEKHMFDNPVANITSKPQIFTLIIRNDSHFEIYVNAKPVRFGSFFKDFKPPIIPPHEIADPTDIKPSDWVDDEYIIDETAKKPIDWNEDEPEFIADPEKLTPPPGWLESEPKRIPDINSRKPKEWDESVFGQWEPDMIPNPKCGAAAGCGPYEPPLIINPKYVGLWEPPMFRNPEYKGKWRPRKIVNPAYFKDNKPYNFSQIVAVGFDIWTVDNGLQFSKIIIGNNVDEVERFNKKNYPQFFETEEKTDSAKSKGSVVFDVPKIDPKLLKIKEDPKLQKFDQKIQSIEDAVEIFKIYFAKNPLLMSAFLLAMAVFPILFSIIFKKEE